MSNAKRISKDILEIKNILEKSRVGLREDVFVERHLSTIQANGKPTLEQQIELVRLAGGENKRINILDNSDNILITLPSALSSGKTIDDKSSKITKALSDGDSKNIDAARRARIDNTVKDIADTKLNELSNDWGFVIDFFKDRFADQMWLIYDTKRHYGFYYDLKEAKEITLQDDEHLLDGKLNDALMAEDEKLFQQLWKNYLQKLTIKERLNLKLQRQHMPKRFWKYLTEKQ